ncbi:hypothetical protein FZEAL_7825 [Fusarium zealandicum]|uniref:Uncharacterized protein n=1 Tax=Fusarium zealandicum TaxID=1053134 RepID=A0A8H4UFT2_9HYPO|nr:hypothetical protein FZEAL_7825 [Fusarium zealandicum]
MQSQQFSLYAASGLVVTYLTLLSYMLYTSLFIHRKRVVLHIHKVPAKHLPRVPAKERPVFATVDKEDFPWAAVVRSNKGAPVKPLDKELYTTAMRRADGKVWVARGPGRRLRLRYRG